MGERRTMARRGGRRQRSTGEAPSRRGQARDAPSIRRVELVYLPGLEPAVRDEVEHQLSGVQRLWVVPGREDSLGLDLRGSLAPLLELRTVVAPFLVLSFPVPRPKSLLSGEYFPQIVDVIHEVQRLNAADPPSGLRIEAAGRDTTVMRTFAGQLAEATGLVEDPEAGECVVRVRRTPQGEGWDVLVRVSTLPLSARPWRVQGHPAAANATVAAAMVNITDPRPTDRVVNLMCGSGTLLVERLIAAPAKVAIGMDRDADAVTATAENLDAAHLAGRADLLVNDIRDDEWVRRGPFDVLLADPPWGDKTGRHEQNEAVHLALLERAHVAAAPGALLVVLTHEIRIMERCLVRASGLWRLRSETRVFHKGHHPRIYLLSKLG